jgi:hypothetical protein
MPPASERAFSKISAVRSIGAALILSVGSAAALAAAPPIRTSNGNAVPGCVTPQRLMAFLKSRNHDIDPRFAGIASLYKRHGETWRVRWDYAFFQMAVETNFLSFKRGDGHPGDVDPRQNNFAGLGTTGDGVPGDSYPDVDTGVLAQIEHLVVYSGEAVADPVGPRTRLKQDDILQSVAHLEGRTTFADLSRRWASDRHYGAAIEWVAGNYRAAYCAQSAGKTETKSQPAGEKPPVKSPPVETATQLASVESQLPAAAALGGPETNESDAPPVRTIWSRSGHPEPTASAPAKTQPLPRPQKRSVATPPAVPEKAPAPPATASAPAQAAAPEEPIVVPTPVEVTPAPKPPQPQPLLQPASNEEPRAFAFAAAMVAAAAANPSAEAAARCRVFAASYGGTKTLLVRTQAGGELQLTALTVLAGFEDAMLAGYVKAHAPGGSSMGSFDSRDAALAKAGELCAGTGEAPHRQGASG